MDVLEADIHTVCGDLMDVVKSSSHTHGQVNHAYMYLISLTRIKVTICLLLRWCCFVHLTL